MKFYRIDWLARGPAEEAWTDWSTSWDDAHRIGRAQSEYYTVTQVEVPEKKAELLAFLRTHIRRTPAPAKEETRDGASRAA